MCSPLCESDGSGSVYPHVGSPDRQLRKSNDLKYLKYPMKNAAPDAIWYDLLTARRPLGIETARRLHLVPQLLRLCVLAMLPQH